MLDVGKRAPEWQIFDHVSDPLNQGSASFSFGAPKVLFEGRFEVTTGGRNQNYDVTPDGRFLMIQRHETESPREIRVVLNWTEELKRLLPRTC